MRNRLSLQTWVESTQTVPQVGGENWRQGLAEMTIGFAQNSLSRNDYDEESEFSALPCLGLQE